MDIKDIQELIKFVAKSGATEVDLEIDNVKISIKSTFFTKFLGMILNILIDALHEVLEFFYRTNRRIVFRIDYAKRG